MTSVFSHPWPPRSSGGGVRLDACALKLPTSAESGDKILFNLFY